MRPCRCPSPTTVAFSSERTFTALEKLCKKQKIPFPNSSRQDWFGCPANSPLAKDAPDGFGCSLSTASSASSSGISSTGIFVVVSPYSTGPCSAVLGTRGFLAGGRRAVIPLGAACLSVCLSVSSICVLNKPSCAWGGQSAFPSQGHPPKGSSPSLRSSCPWFS